MALQGIACCFQSRAIKLKITRVDFGGDSMNVISFILFPCKTSVQ